MSYCHLAVVCLPSLHIDPCIGLLCEWRLVREAACAFWRSRACTALLNDREGHSEKSARAMSPVGCGCALEGRREGRHPEAQSRGEVGERK